MIERHFHWEFVAYNGDPLAEKMHWAVVVEVIGWQTEEDAKVAAADVVRRDNYGLRHVRECASCGFQRQVSENFDKMIEKM